MPKTIRSRFLMLFSAAALTVAGCQVAPPSMPEPVVPPIAPDEAMQHRADWPRFTQYYASGAVIAGHTCFLFVPSGPEGTRSFTEIALFTVQSPAVPFVMPFVPNKVVYRGFRYDPTYTFSPPLR